MTIRTHPRKCYTLMVHSWSTPVSPTEAARRAGGRRRYNATRTFRAAVRRRQVIELLFAHGFTYGSQRRAAEALGVSPATITRDTKALQTWWVRSGFVIWPTDLRTPKGAARVLGRMAKTGQEIGG
jgi:hypothetical protein